MLGWVFGFFSVSLILYQLWLGSFRFFGESRRLEAEADLQRLVRATEKVFPDRNPKDENAFWKALDNRDPLLDPWKRPYKMIRNQRGELFWVSLGPDGILSSPDDLFLLVSANALGPFNGAAAPLEGPTSTDAR